MGGTQSSTLTEITSVLNSCVVNVMNTDETNTDNITVASNTFDIVITGTVIDCNIDFTQNIQQTTRTKSITQYNDTTKLQNLMKTALSAALNSSDKAVNNFLATTFQSQNTNITSKNDFQNILDTNLKNMDLTNITTTASALNNGTFYISGTVKCDSAQQNLGGAQTIVQNAFASQVSNAILSAFSGNTDLTNILKKLDGENSSANTGIGEALQKVFTSLGLFILLPLLIIIIIVAGIILLFKLGKGKKPGSMINSGINMPPRPR